MERTFLIMLYTYAMCYQFIWSSIVITRYGQIQGVHENGVSKFLGIPYKINSRIPKESFVPPDFTETYWATTYKPACPQDENLLNQTVHSLFGNLTQKLNIPSEFSEDCLYLNVFVPGLVNTNNSLPVMVHIHGGGFQIGSGQLYDPTELVKTGNVIVVTFNYRLGALGFLSFLNNTGLWDQNHAFKWVRENVESFGGDPSKVTIFGEGTGGVAVGLHIVSLESRGLFRRAISMGGTALQSEFIDMNPENVTDIFFAEVGCNATTDVSSCLKDVHLERVLEAQKKLCLLERTFLPFIDGKFLPSTPRHLIETGQFAKVNYIIGFNNDADTMNSLPILTLLNTGISKDIYQQTVRKTVTALYDTNYKMIFDTVMFQYRPTLSSNLYTDNQIWLRQLMDIIRDVTAVHIHNTQTSHSFFGGKVYAYYFDQVPPFSGHSSLMLKAASGMEMAYIFGLLGKDTLGDKIMQAWANFATTGDPSLTTENGQWPLFNGTAKQFAVFNNKFNHSSKVFATYPGKLDKRMSVWTELLPVLASQKRSTICDQQSQKDDDLGTVISLKQGLLQGERKELMDYAWEQFIDIPYAQPPVGALRWRPPKPHSGWTGVRKSSSTSDKLCPQLRYPDSPDVPGKQTEDCLFLDIFVPYAAKHTRYLKLPVMLYIHGGSYAAGSKAMHHGGALTQYGIIVVTINYRLNVFGFLSTGDKAAPGNFGLMDQQLSIRWTKENIEKFGGDPDKITIFGQSAGASSVILQMLSPENKGLFKNVIAESGSALSFWALDRFNLVKKKACSLGHKVSCPTSNSHLMVGCLRKKCWKDIIHMGECYLMRPVIDGKFIPNAPEELYRKNVTREFNLMTGTNEHEGFAYLNNLDAYLHAVLSGTLQYLTNNPKAVAAAFNLTYADLLDADAKSRPTEYLQKGTDLFTDLHFLAGADRDARLHSKYGGKTYRYLFQFKPALSIYAHGSPDWVQGTHGDELIYVFGWPELINRGLSFQPIDTFLPANYAANNFTYPEKDLTLSRLILTLWTNFASTGDPNKELDLPGFKWPLFTDKHPNILKLSANLSQSGHDPVIKPDLLRPDKVAFWNELVPCLEQKTHQCPAGTENVNSSTENENSSAKYDEDKLTDKASEDWTCTPDIVEVTIWTLGIISGLLLVALIIVSCKFVIITKKYKKLEARLDKSSLIDTLDMEAEHQL